MEIAQTQKNEFLILRPIGRLDTKTSPELEKKIVEQLNSGSRRFVIDLADVEYVSSAGLRVMLMLAKKLSGTEGHLALCCLNAHVQQVFEIAGFLPLFSISASAAEAIRQAPTQSKSSMAAELAAKALGVLNPSRRAVLQEPVSDLALRAARLLGVKLPAAEAGTESGQPSKPTGPNGAKDSQKKDKPPRP